MGSAVLCILRTLPAVVALTTIVSSPRCSSAASQSVTIADFGFTPTSISVSVGDGVTWRNSSGEAHTATANAGAFDTGVLNPGASKTVVFGIAGTYDCHCAIHTSRGPDPR